MKLIITATIACFTFYAGAQTMVSTFAGNGVAGLTNGAAANSQFNSPTGICRDNNGNMYVADCLNNCIRKIDSMGIVTTYAGSFIGGYQDGPAATARFNQPFCICVDDSDNLYVTDFNNQRIRKISASGYVSTLAGSGVEGYNDGVGIAAMFDYPRGITLDAQGNLFIADSWNHRIRKIDAITHYVSTYAGGGTITGVGTNGGYIDAADTAARFHTPTGVAIDAAGTLYITDALNHRIRMIDPQQQVTTIAGSGTVGGFMNGAALSAMLNTPTDLCRTANGDLFISDTYNNRVRLLSGGMVSTVAGSGVAGFVNGTDITSQFNYPRGIMANPNVDSILVMDYNNHAIRLIALAPTGINEQVKNESNIFPNPANDVIYVALENNLATASHIRIIDIQGRMIQEQFVDKGNGIVEINVAGILPGVYVVKINNAVQRLVKTK